MAYPQTNGKPKYNEFITPIGLLVHCNHDRPLLKTNDKTKQPILDEAGIQEAEYRVTMAWEKPRINELQPLIQLARTTQEEAWPGSTAPGAFFHLETVFRDGDNPAHNTAKKEYLFGKYYMNFKQKALSAKNPANGQIIYSGAPGLLGPYGEDIMPMDVYGGCTGRISGIMFGSEYMGKNFISVRLNNIQKFEDGERIGGGSRPDPKTQFTPLKQGGMRDVL